MGCAKSPFTERLSGVARHVISVCGDLVAELGTYGSVDRFAHLARPSLPGYGHLYPVAAVHTLVKEGHIVEAEEVRQLGN